MKHEVLDWKIPDTHPHDKISNQTQERNINLSLQFPHVYGGIVIGLFAIRVDTTFLGFIEETEDVGCSIRCIIQSAAGVALCFTGLWSRLEETENLNPVILHFAECQLLLHMMACGSSVRGVTELEWDLNGT